MDIHLKIEQADIDEMSQEVADMLNACRQPVQGAMGEAYFEIVRSNFGDVGVDRPISWLPLSWSYAQRVKRSNATLYVTGRLESAIQFSNADPNEATVSVSGVPYAAAHQYGYAPNNLPPRPYFPFNPYNGETTPFTLNVVKEAAEKELARCLWGGAL